MRVQFQIVGSLKRSTLDRSYPDPEWQALTDVLQWSWSCRLQASRLRRSFLKELTPRQELYVFEWRHLSATSYDDHCLATAAANLDRALANAETFLKTIGPPKRTRRALRLLRNIYEHWDELRDAFRQGDLKKTGAAKKLCQEFPEAEPWSLKIDETQDIVLAEVVSMRKLVKDLRTLEATVLWRQRQLRREGRHKAP